MRKKVNTLILTALTAASVALSSTPEIIPGGTLLTAAAVFVVVSSPPKCVASITPGLHAVVSIFQPPACQASVMGQLCSHVTSFLDGEAEKAGADLKNCKKNCLWKKNKNELITAANKKARDSCAKGEAPDINAINKGLDADAKTRLKNLYNQNSRMFDGKAKLPNKDFEPIPSKQPALLAGRGGQVTDLKSAEPAIPRLNPASEFSLAGTKLTGGTSEPASTKQSTVLLVPAAPGKTSANTAPESSAIFPADNAASAKTAVAAQNIAASDQPEPTVDCKCYYNPEDWAGGLMSPGECEKMKAIKCCPKDQHKNAAGKCVSSPSWFEGSWFEKQKDKALYLGKGWLDNAKLLADWIAGHGEKDRHYGPGDRLTIDMQSAQMVQMAREEYQGKEIVKYENGLSALQSSGLNPGQQQVGGYRLTLTPNPDGTVHFKIDNDLSLWSFFYHIPGLPLNKEDGYFRNIHQTIEWDEKIPKK